MAAGVLDVGLAPLAEYQIAGVEVHPGKETLATHLVPLGPLLDRVVRPPRPQPTVGTVTIRCTHATGLATGRLPRVPGTIGIDHRDPGTQPLQVKRGPQAKGTGADNDHVGRPVGLGRTTAWPGEGSGRCGGHTGTNGESGRRGRGNESASINRHGWCPFSSCSAARQTRIIGLWVCREGG